MLKGLRGCVFIQRLTGCRAIEVDINVSNPSAGPGSNTHSYTYNPAGKRQNALEPSGQRAYTANEVNQYTSVQDDQP